MNASQRRCQNCGSLRKDHDRKTGKCLSRVLSTAWEPWAPGEPVALPEKLSGPEEAARTIQDARHGLSGARFGLQEAFAALVNAHDLLPAYANRITALDSQIQELWSELGQVWNGVAK